MAAPSLAGAAGVPYRAFAGRLLVMRLPWLAGMLIAGALAAHSLAAIGRVAGIAGLAASAVVAAGLLAVHGRLPVRSLGRQPRVRLAGMLLVAALAALMCGALLQDTAAGEETVRLNPQIAEVLARHVPPDAAWNAVGLSHLARPPGLWFMAVMAVLFLDVKRRGRSTLRIAAAAGDRRAAVHRPGGRCLPRHRCHRDGRAGVAAAVGSLARRPAPAHDRACVMFQAIFQM